MPSIAAAARRFAESGLYPAAVRCTGPRSPAPRSSAASGARRSQRTLVKSLKINNIRAAAPSRGLHLFWEPFGGRKRYCRFGCRMAKVKHEQDLFESERSFRLLVEGVADYALYMLDPE